MKKYASYREVQGLIEDIQDYYDIEHREAVKMLAECLGCSESSIRQMENENSLRFMRHNDYRLASVLLIHKKI